MKSHQLSYPSRLAPVCICISDKLDSHALPIQAFMFLICQYTKTNSSVTIGVRVMMLNPTFNDILVISWRSVLLVEDPEKPAASH
jgi:hypothetical protein